MWNYDTYEYGDTFENDVAAMRQIENLLQDQDSIDSLMEFLNDVLESEDQEMVKEAAEIKQLLIEMN